MNSIIKRSQVHNPRAKNIRYGRGEAARTPITNITISSKIFVKPPADVGSSRGNHKGLCIKVSVPIPRLKRGNTSMAAPRGFYYVHITLPISRKTNILASYRQFIEYQISRIRLHDIDQHRRGNRTIITSIKYIMVDDRGSIVSSS